MELSFVLAPVILTSLCALLLATRKFGLTWSGLREAAGHMLECIGVTLVFLVANIGATVLVVFAGRVLLRGFVSLYFANDVVLLGLSLLQGLTFQRWWES